MSILWPIINIIKIQYQYHELSINDKILNTSKYYNMTHLAVLYDHIKIEHAW